MDALCSGAQAVKSEYRQWNLYIDTEESTLAEQNDNRNTGITGNSSVRHRWKRRKVEYAKSPIRGSCDYARKFWCDQIGPIVHRIYPLGLALPPPLLLKHFLGSFPSRCRLQHVVSSGGTNVLDWERCFQDHSGVVS